MSLAKLRKIDRGRRDLPLASRRRAHRADARALDRDPAPARHADITMAFDECTPFPATEDQARQSMELSMRWAARCKDAFDERATGHGLFGIVQGGVYPALRQDRRRR